MSDKSLSAIVRPVMGLPFRIALIDAGEIQFLLEVKDSELINEILLMEQRLDSLTSALCAYHDKRIEHSDFLASRGQIEELDGTAFTTTLSGEDAQFAQVTIKSLDMLITSVSERIDDDLKHACETMIQYYKSALNFFGEGNFPNMELTEKVGGVKVNELAAQ